jgi:hypothetical protein
MVMNAQIRSNDPGAKSSATNIPSRIHERRCVGAAAIAEVEGSTPTSSVNPALARHSRKTPVPVPISSTLWRRANLAKVGWMARKYASAASLASSELS